MSELNHQPPPGDALDRAVATTWGQAIPEPPADLTAAVSAAVTNRLQLAEAMARRRRWIVRGMTMSGLVACLAVAVTWGGKADASELLRAALDNLEKAKSYRAVVRTTLADPPAGMPPMPEQKLYGQGEKMRMEMGDTVTMSDGKRLVMLDTKAKVARTADLPAETAEKVISELQAILDAKGTKAKATGTADLPAEPNETAKGVMAGVQKLLDAQDGKEAVQPVPAVEIGGKKRPGFRVTGVAFAPGQSAEVTYYLDEQKKLPLRYEFALDKPTKMTVTTDYLGFDEKLDPKLFSLDIPEGYKREELKLPGTAPKKESGNPPQLVETPKRERTRPVSLSVAAEAVAAAPSLVVVNTQRTRVGGPELTVKMYFRGQRMRMEFLDPNGKAVGALVAGFDADHSLHLDFAAKTAKFEKRTGPRPATVPDLVAGFSQLKDEDGEAAGDEKVGDVTAKVFKLKSAKFLGVSGPDVATTVWLDPATSLPVQVRVTDGENVDLRFERFEWPATLADSLFSLTPPKGYAVSEFVPPGPAGKK